MRKSSWRDAPVNYASARLSSGGCRRRSRIGGSLANGIQPVRNAVWSLIITAGASNRCGMGRDHRQRLACLVGDVF